MSNQTPTEQISDAFKHKFGNRTIGGLLLSGVKKIFKPILSFIGKWTAVSLFIFALAWTFAPKPKPLEDGTTLYISIDRPLAEATQFDTMPYLQFLLRPPMLSATTITNAIHDAVENEKIAQIVVSADGARPANAGAAQRIGDALKMASDHGKKVTVYASNYDNAKYLLAAGADKILMHPMGRFDAGGVKTGALYFGEALKRFGVDVVVGQAGTYKNAIEPYTRGGMSGPAREAITSVLERQSRAMTQTIAEKSGHSVDAVSKTLMADAGTWSIASKAATDAGFIDDVITAPAFMDLAFGAPGDNDASPFVALSRYLTLKRPDHCAAAWSENGVKGKKGHDTIGLLTIEGEIRTGFTADNVAGAASLIAQIEGYARSSRNKGLLIRINSPGGDAQASEMIRASLERYRAMGRPVIVTMGSMAASGGYWIASAGDKIYAEPTTITGSIGVFAMRASAAGLLGAYDVKWDGLAVGRHNPFGALGEKPSLEETAALKNDVDVIYDQFIDLVAGARDLDRKTYKDWAEGRVWHASDALDKKLVDQIGGLEDALHELARVTSTPLQCLTLPRPVTSAQSVLSSFSPMSGVLERISVVTSLLRANAYPALLTDTDRALQRVTSSGGVQAMCLTCAVE